MSMTNQIRHLNPQATGDGEEYVPDTRVSTYDKTSAFLMANIAVLGLLVFIAFLVWLTLFPWQIRSIAVPMEEMMGNDNNPEGIADDWQEPGVEEFPEVEQPQLADAVQAMTDAVSSVRAQLEEYDGNMMEMGTGPGLGDQRESGPGSGGPLEVPESARWRIEYSATNLMEYLQQLEHFRVQLGAVSTTTNRIDLISNLTRNPSTLTATDRSQEKRIYFSYRESRLKRWDQAIARNAGVRDIEDRFIVQFYEEDVRAILRQLEHDYVQSEGRQVIEVQRTFFRVRPSGSGYEYYVHRVEYRPMPGQA